MADESKTKQYRDLITGLDKTRQTWIPQWKEIEQYALPGRGMFMNQGALPNDGSKRHLKIFDGAAVYAMRILGAGLHGGLTSPARDWFRMKLADDELEKFGPIKQWLHDSRRVLMGIYSQSNFYTIIHQGYEELGGFGTTSLFQEEDPQKVVRFKVFPIGSYYLDTNASGIVDTQAYQYWMTARQMVEQFGESKVSQTVKNSAKSNNNQSYEVVHVVQPNKDRDVTKPDSKNLPFESVYFEYRGDSEKILSKSGYFENPCHSPRWIVTGPNVYGWSPCMDALADTKMLQSMSADRAKAQHKRTDPATMQPVSFKKKLRINAGAQNFVDKAEWTEGIKPIYQINPDVEGATSLIQDVRQQIRTGLYTDLFLMLQGLEATGRNITATEIAERHTEKLLMLGPVIERQFHELLDPIIDRTFNIALRRGLIPPWPDELNNTDMSVEYISTLAQAQKRVGTVGISALSDYAGSLAQIWPEVADKFNADTAVEEYADLIGADPKVINDDEKVQQIRAKRAQDQKEAAQQEQMAGMVQGAKTLSETDTSGKNALTQLTESLEGQ